MREKEGLRENLKDKFSPEKFTEVTRVEMCHNRASAITSVVVLLCEVL